MFNKLPKYVRIVSSCSVDKFKSQLAKHLRNIVDLPCQSGWWRLFEWRSLRGRPGCQLDATEQPQVTSMGFQLFHKNMWCLMCRHSLLSLCFAESIPCLQTVESMECHNLSPSLREGY